MNNLEQNFFNKSEEKIENSEIIKKEVLSQASIAENKPTEEEKQKEIENNKQIEEIKEKILQQFGGQELKEEFPEGHIMSPQILEVISQLEAINPNDEKFDEYLYKTYKNGQAKLGSYSIGANQKKIQDNLNKGKDLTNSISSSRLEVIYGNGGWNRYIIDKSTGQVVLSRGSSNATGSPEYRTALANKAKELGIKVEE